MSWSQEIKIFWNESDQIPDILITDPRGFFRRSAQRNESVKFGMSDHNAMVQDLTIGRFEEIGSVVSHRDWSRLPAVRDGRVYAVDAGSYFSRPGPRLIDGVALLATLCHPSLFENVVPPCAYRIT